MLLEDGEPDASEQEVDERGDGYGEGVAADGVHGGAFRCEDSGSGGIVAEAGSAWGIYVTGCGLVEVGAA